MPLAFRARTVTAKDVVRVNGVVAVGPLDGQDGGAMGGLDFEGVRNLGCHLGDIMSLLNRIARPLEAEDGAVGAFIKARAFDRRTG